MGYVQDVVRDVAVRFKAESAWRDAVSRFWYCEVDEVDPEVRAAGEAMLEACAPPWPVKIRWCVPEGAQEREYLKRYPGGAEDWPRISTDVDAGGLAVPAKRDEIWIRADLGAERAASAVAHELRHTRQFDLSRPLEEREAEAEMYAKEMMAQLAPRRPRTLGDALARVGI